MLRRPFESTQYTSIAFGQRRRDAGVRLSMGLVGDCFDNAMCESFFATLECELLDRRHFKTQIEARLKQTHLSLTVIRIKPIDMLQ
jgi:putative transposase